MKKSFRLLVKIALGLSLTIVQACSSNTNLTTQPPPHQVTVTPVFTPKLSTITVPVSFKLSTLEDKLNQEFKGLLFKDENLEDDNIAVTVTKNGRLGMQAEGNKLAFTMPLRIYAKGRWVWEACKICPKLQKTEDTEFDIVIKSQSLLSFTEDYKINSVTTGDFEWGNTKPVITLGPLKIGLARFVEPALRDQMKTLTAQLDQEIQKRINIKEYVQQAWIQIQKPILLDQNLNAWLTVTPTAIRVSPLMARNGDLNMQIGFSSYLQTATNGKPQPEINPTLPKLVTDSRMPNEVQIGVVSELSYLHATKLLKVQVIGQKYSFEGGKDQVTVNDLALTGSGDKLVLMLDVTGKTKAGFFTKNITGKIFLKAMPYYDAASQSIRVRDLDYDLNTKDKILQTASWLAKNKFVQNIQSQINFPVKTQLEDARKMLQKTLDSSGRINESVLLKGKITEIVPDVIYVTPTSLKALIHAKGNLTAQIDKL